jgi:hypothetical protein
MSSINNSSDLTINREKTQRQLSELSCEDNDESFFFSTESQHNIMSSMGDMAASESGFLNLPLVTDRVSNAPISRDSLAERSFGLCTENESSLRLSAFNFSSANFDTQTGKLERLFLRGNAGRAPLYGFQLVF